jgi:hypothetical protein
MLALSKRWASVLLAQPESGMGYQIATVTLKDGRQFPRSIITEGRITKVGDSNEIPFADSDIETIIVDHGQAVAR